MKRILAAGLAAAALSYLAVSSALANGAPRPIRPRPVPPEPAVNPEVAPGPVRPEIIPNGRLTIEARDDVNAMRLQIPREMFNALQPRPKPEVKADAGIGPERTVAAGIALSAAMMVGGLWLVRSVRPARALFVVPALVGIGAAAVWADVAPRPPRPQPLPPIQVDPPAPPVVVLPAVLTGPILVEIVDGIKEAKLIVNRKMLASLADKPFRIQPAEPIRPPAAEPIRPPGAEPRE